MAWLPLAEELSDRREVACRMYTPSLIAFIRGNPFDLLTRITQGIRKNLRDELVEENQLLSEDSLSSELSQDADLATGPASCSRRSYSGSHHIECHGATVRGRTSSTIAALNFAGCAMPVRGRRWRTHCRHARCLGPCRRLELKSYCFRSERLHSR